MSYQKGRRFATWAPLLIPFYIPRGAEWDQVWTGAERVAAAHGPLLPAVSTLMLAYGVVAAALAMVLLVRWARVGFTLPAWAPRAEAPPTSFSITNGFYTVEVSPDGRGFSRVLSAVRPGFEFDITKRPDDPLQLRGKFVFLREVDEHDLALGPAWSLGRQPMLTIGPDFQVTQLSPTALKLANSAYGLYAEATIEVPRDRPLERWRVRIENRESRRRWVELTTYQEWGLHAAGAYQRTPGYNAMHIGTYFVRSLHAVLGRNRLLKTPHADPAQQHMRARSRSTRWAWPSRVRPALSATRTAAVASSAPARCETRRHWRRKACATPRTRACSTISTPSPACASLSSWRPGLRSRCRFSMGWPRTSRRPRDYRRPSCARRNRRRDSSPLPWSGWELIEHYRRNPETSCYSFSPDGMEVRTTPDTSRPWGHVMANALGQGTILSNDGEFSRSPATLSRMA